MRIPLSAAMGAAALLAATSGSAAARDVSGSLTVTGGVTVTWKGDPARGCMDAGLCGYGGALKLAAGRHKGQYSLSLDARNADGSSSAIDLARMPEVVVRRAEAGVEQGTCADRARDPNLAFDTKRAKPGRVRFFLLAPDLSSARCAGPPLERVLERLRPRTMRIRAISGGNVTIDLSGSAPYSAGRFSGRVKSTLRFHLVRARPPARRLAAARRRPLVRVASIHVVYRIAAYHGELAASFGGLTEPPCADLDLCGVAGSARWRIRAHGGKVVVDAAGRARRSDRGLRGAIAAIRRSDAYVYAFADIPDVTGATTAEVTRPGGTACHDTARVLSRGLDMIVPAGIPRVELGGPDAYESDRDLLRAGCPGPRDFDVFGFGPAASGPLKLSSLGKRTLALTLTGSGHFRGRGYSGSQNARFTLDLHRRSLRVAYRRTRYVLPP
jgi:hypothetical protein